MPHPRLITLVAFAFLSASPGLAAADKAASKPKVVKYEANLSQIPTTDPKATKPVTVAKDHVGQHPRLLFSEAEVAALKELCENNPVLKQAADDTIAWARSYKPPTKSPDFVNEDTPAIWLSGGTYPGMAYAYHLTKDPAIKAKIIGILTMMVNEPYWANTPELDCNMGAGNNMLMVGILFDAVCTELEPDFRAKAAQKILTHVRRMWYLGHQQLAKDVVKYWQQDPQNNHRWHRNAGMAACLLAIADEPGLDTGFMLEQFRGEMDFITTWLPDAGDCHEGATYQQFGFMYLALATRMMDRVLGTTYQQHPALRNAWTQQVHYWAPGRGGNMSFGDDSNGNGNNFDRLDAAFFIGPQLSRDPLAQAVLLKRMHTFRSMKSGQSLPWTMLTFYDPTVKPGDEDAMPKHVLLSDLGAVSMRDAWTADAVAMTFKCGPYGGAKLNEFAHHTGKQTYINVAHDDPDANSFALAMDGDLIFHPGTYSMPKKTETISSILVDGKGQINEGSGYTQPVKNTDMRSLAYLTGWKIGADGALIVEGEAGKSYPGRLDRFRRSVIWLPGDYILVLDDITAEKPQSITWIGVASDAELTDAGAGMGSATGKEGKTVAFQVLADAELTPEVKPVAMPGRRSSTTLDQIRFTATAQTVRFACILDPWKRKPTATLSTAGTSVTLSITVDGQNDVWTWDGADDATTASRIQGKRGKKDLIGLSATDRVPATH